MLREVWKPVNRPRIKKWTLTPLPRNTSPESENRSQGREGANRGVRAVRDPRSPGRSRREQGQRQNRGPCAGNQSAEAETQRPAGDTRDRAAGARGKRLNGTSGETGRSWSASRLGPEGGPAGGAVGGATSARARNPRGSHRATPASPRTNPPPEGDADGPPAGPQLVRQRSCRPGQAYHDVYAFL